MRNSDRHRALAGIAIATMVVMVVWSTRTAAETIDGAMARAYQSNPQLNAQRAQLRAVDEGVPQALSGYRPKVNVTATAGEQYTDQTLKNVFPATPVNPKITTYAKQFANTQPYSVGATLNQPVFDGFITPNRVRAADGNVSAQREALRVLEQTVLLAAATAYMDVSRDAASLEVNRINVRTLEELLSQTRERFNAGEVTSTDVAQAEAQLAAGRTAASASESQYNTSRATYRQIIGIDPGNLSSASPVDRFSPTSLGAAIERGQIENPNVTAAMYGIDVAYLQVKINEGALFPQLNVQANVQYANSPQIGITNQGVASAIAALTVPIYQGGGEYALIRQSKDTLEQQRLNLDTVRSQIRQNVVQAWGQVQASKTQVQSTGVQVNSAQTALNGIRQEAKVGQRTTFDILTAQQNLVNARLALLVAQHDRVVASYSLLDKTGRLAPQVLGLPTAVYDPTVHYRNARDAWVGVRPHDGDKNFQVGSSDASEAAAMRQAAAIDPGKEPTAKEEPGRHMATTEDAKGEDGKGEDDKGESKKADGRKLPPPLSLARAASGAPREAAPEPMMSPPAAAPRPAAARSRTVPMSTGRTPDGNLQPEDLLSTRDIQPEPARREPAPAPRATSGAGLMQGAVPVMSSGRFGGSRPVPDAAPPAADPAPGTATPAAPVARPMSGSLPALPSDRFDTRAPAAQPRFVTSDSRSDSYAEPAPPAGRPDGPFARIR